MKSRFSARVYLAYPDGSVRPVSRPHGLFYQASVNAAGTDVVFYGAQSGQLRLWRHEVDQPQPSPVPITSAEAGARHPSFDWAGERLVFAFDDPFPEQTQTVETLSAATRETDPSLRLNLFTMNPDGSDLAQVTEGPYLDHRPSFSPDGRWIAFASNRSGDAAIWRVPADGSSDPTPVFTDHWGFRPWYSGDGNRILFYGPDGARHRIWCVDVTTGLAIPLTSDDRGMTHGPFVPPASEDELLVHSTRGGAWGIWRLPIDGDARPVELTPPDFPGAAHPTMSREGLMAFDIKTPAD